MGFYDIAAAGKRKNSVISDTLAEYYFNNNINDSSGNGYDLTLTLHNVNTDVTYTTGHDSTSNSAIKIQPTASYDGHSASLSVNIPPIENNTQVSFSFWLYTNDAFNCIPLVRIATAYNSGIDGTGSFMDSRFLNFNKNSRVDTAFASMNNIWHHVVWQLNGNACEIYIDGTLTSSFNFSTSGTATGNFFIQCYNYSQTTKYVIFDNIKIFPTIRTQEQVTALYNE